MGATCNLYCLFTLVIYLHLRTLNIRVIILSRLVKFIVRGPPVALLTSGATSTFRVERVPRLHPGVEALLFTLNIPGALLSLLSHHFCIASDPPCS